MTEPCMDTSVVIRLVSGDDQTKQAAFPGSPARSLDLFSTSIDRRIPDAPTVEAERDGLLRTTNRMSYAAVAGPNQVVSASWSPRGGRSPTQATCPSGRINTAVGAVTVPRT